MAVSPKTSSLFGIGKLRAETDFSPYLPTNGAPPWLLRLSRITQEDLGALAILGPNGVSIGSPDGTRTRVVPDAASLYITGLADTIRGTGQRIAVGMPPNARHLPLLLASAAVLKSTLERARGALRARSVLVISRDLDIRSRYCDLYVRKEMLDDAHPGSRMRPNGEVLSLRPHEDDPTSSGGVCFFLPEIDLPEDVKLSPSLVVLDLRYARWVKRAQNLAEWVKGKYGGSGAVALYTIGDQDSTFALSQAGFNEIPFDHAAIATCSQHVQESDGQFNAVDLSLADAPSYLVRTHIIEEIAGSDVLAELYSANARLLYEQHKQDNPDLNRARWLLAVMSHMPVPLSWFEITARGMGRSTLKRLIDLLGSLSKREKGMGAIVQTARMHLQQLYAQLEQDNPRAGALRSLVDGAARKVDDKLLVLVRDRTMAQALDSWLAVEACPDAEWLPRLEVRSYDTYSEVANHQYCSVIINGSIPRRYRWVLGGALGKTVCFLGYPYESEIIEKHLEFVYGDATRKGNLQTRERSVGALVGISTPNPTTNEGKNPLARLVVKRKVAHGKPSASAKSIRAAGGFAGLSEAMKLARDRVEQEVVVARSVDQDVEVDLSELDQVSGAEELDNLDQAFSCLPVKVRSRRYGRGKIWFREDSLVECVRPSSGEEIWRVPPRSLKSGDVLLRVENSEIRGSLFDQMVHLAEGQPEMDYLASFRKTWREAIQKIVARNCTAYAIDYGKVFQALRAAGAPISSEQTVRLWMHDQVIGPEAVESIEAVGQVSGSGALVSQAKRFDAAFRSIRAIHQGIGRRLSSAIRESFRHLHFEEVKTRVERLDDRLGIPLDELVETVDLAEVLSVGTTAERKSAQVVNHFYSAEGE
jgi:hypothetical protein